MVTQYLREFVLQWRPAVGLNGEPVPAPLGETIRTADDAARLVRPLIADDYREVAIALMLSVDLKVIGVHTVAVGTLDAFVTHPRDVLRAAMLSNADTFYFCHNHPNGSLAPSAEDLDLTAGIVRAGQAVDLPCTDSIIVACGVTQVMSLRSACPHLWATKDRPRLSPLAAVALQHVVGKPGNQPLLSEQR